MWQGLARQTNPIPPHEKQKPGQSTLTLLSHSAFSTSGKLTWRWKKMDSDEAYPLLVVSC